VIEKGKIMKYASIPAIAITAAGQVASATLKSASASDELFFGRNKDRPFGVSTR